MSEKKAAQAEVDPEGQKFQAIVARLKASKERGVLSDHTDGVSFGQSWAEKDAEWGDLDRMWDWELNNQPPTMDDVRICCDPNGNMDQSDWSGFFNLERGALPSDGFIVGFWEGAMEVYGKVRAKV